MTQYVQHKSGQGEKEAMNRLGLWECVVLVCFWAAGLASVLLGGMTMLGYVVMAFLWTGFGWVAYQLYVEYAESVKVEFYRRQIFDEWARRDRLKGMDQ